MHPGREPTEPSEHPQGLDGLARPRVREQRLGQGPACGPTGWVGSEATAPGVVCLSEGVVYMTKDLSGGKNRKNLEKSSFALPEQEKYPIPDLEHARNALARVAQHGSQAEKKQVRAAVEKKYPSLRKDD